MRTAAVFILFLLLQPMLAVAKDKNGNYAIWGMGRKTCYSYTKAREAGDYAPYKDYMMGYFTAYNEITEETYLISGNMDLNEILEWMDEYCEQKQMNSFDLVLGDFILEHIEKRMKTAPSKSGR